MRSLHIGKPKKGLLAQRFAHKALNRVLADYLQTAQQATDRVQRLTQDIAELVEDWAMATLVKSLQTFHGVQLVTAGRGSQGRIQRLGPVLRESEPVLRIPGWIIAAAW